MAQHASRRMKARIRRKPLASAPGQAPHGKTGTLRRSIGYMIQEVGLLPHFSVARNIGLVPSLPYKPFAGFLGQHGHGNPDNITGRRRIEAQV